MEAKKGRIGVAFGGGGTRGIAHIGAIRVFQENHIRFDLIAGNSAGSLAGAVYAAGLDWQELYAVVRHIGSRQLIRGKSRFPAVNSRFLTILANRFFHNKTFEDLAMPFAVIAVNIDSGQLEVLRQGRLGAAISASCAVPGIFKPVKIDGRLYVDGGVRQSVPVDAAREMGADVVVGIHLNGYPNPDTIKLPKGFPLDISPRQTLENTGAEVLIAPNLVQYDWSCFEQVEDVLREGEEAAKRQLDALLCLMESGAKPIEKNYEKNTSA